ncbi:NADH-quinone oxidoreductase subunit B family protein [Nitratiruptor sp. SB155-2]|uniref:NADH-quinone oxidoreductase subunit B family protein n=1 Tax=Nitratiruptor sp. (strain SB155-2) TaxID=387092 RepID=UPI00015872A9|nr:hydrogenase [Nitratiruptor sp. SB155-2]BAF69828.1 Ni-Fe hydrogenase, small subunit HycG [Nitratiruptor sp. SB155-2]
MIDFWVQRFRKGIQTQNSWADEELETIKKSLKSEIGKKFSGSLAIRMVDSGSCNACEAECNALSNPYYDLERLGIRFVASPRHADILLVSGVVTFNMLPHLLDAYEQLPSPKWVITLGDCTQGTLFKDSFAIKGPVKEHLPVAYHIPGCPPTPDEIVRGFLGFLRSL